jgi:Ca2+-binding RTX toxin-like protein
MPPRRTALLAVLSFMALAAPAEAARLYAVTESRQLLAFDALAPGLVLSATPITGLVQGPATEKIKGVDVRPATGEMLLVTRTPGTSRLYRLDVATGTASQPLTLGEDLLDESYGVAVDPVEDNLRVTGADATHRTFSLASGAVTPHAPTDAPYDALAYGSDGRLFAYASDTGGAEDGLGGKGPGGDEDDGQFGPLATTAITPDGTRPERVAMDATGSALLLTAFEFGFQRLYVLPLTGGPTAVGVIGESDQDVRGMAAVEGVARLVGGDTAEEGTTASLVVSRDAARGASTVAWTAQSGTASAGSDFATASGTVSFAAGEGAKVISVPLPEDAAVEGAEAFTVTVTGATGGTVLAGPRTATVTVIDDDGAPAAPPPPEQILVPFPVNPPARTLAAGRCANPLGGTSGDDALLGTAAGDAINGGAGADALAGRDGDDCLTGGPGNDWLNGADGTDTMRGDAGEDFLLGGRGDDTLAGGNGDDRLAGGDGGDTISAGGGSNHVVGGSGSDRINTRNGRRDVVDCGGGRDRATIDIRRDKTRACETIPGT